MFRITISNNTVLINPAIDIHCMEIGDFIREMECLAPPALAEEWDRERIGLVVEGKSDLTRICCALDATPHVIREAVNLRADMLVVHHTPIWDPVTSFRSSLATLLRDVLTSGMNVYVMHTNLDHAPGGVNDVLADLLEIGNPAPLSLGIVGECRLGLQELADRLNCGIRTWGRPALPGRLAVIGGSGFIPELIEEARASRACAILSSEARHSVIRSSPLPLIEATHYALESPVMRELSQKMDWVYIEDTPDMQTWTPRNSGIN